jgi:spore coat polysaccharide biosynthesis predicted glycosyltransferase SpsG
MKDFSSNMSNLSFKWNVEFISNNISEDNEIQYINTLMEKYEPLLLITNLKYNYRGYIKKLKKLDIIVLSIVEGDYTECLASDIVINPIPKHNNVSCKNNRYYAGEKYIILDNVIHKYKNKKINKNAKTILINFGGSDPLGLTLYVYNMLYNVHLNLEIVLVIGPAFPYKDKLMALCNKSVNPTTVRENIEIDEMYKIMYDVDIGITAGGTTIFELACIGTPSIAVCPLGRLDKVANAFQEAGVSINLGQYHLIKNNELYNAIIMLALDYKTRQKMSDNGKQYVDGYGSLRILDIIKGL